MIAQPIKLLSRLSQVVIISGLLFSCGGSSEETTTDSTESIRPVKYVQVGNSQLGRVQTFSGISKAEREEALSFRVSGTVSKKYVDVGDLVKKGQPLVVIDPTDYRVNLEQASANQKAYDAQIKSAEANYLSTKSNYDRYQKLYESNSVSLSDFENAKASYESAKASYDAAIEQAQAAATQTQAASNSVGYTRLVAPFSGVVSEVSIEENETANAGQKVVTLSSTGDIEIEVGIPENVISRIKQNDQVKVHFSVVGNNLLDAKVTQVGYSASGSTYPVTVALEQSDDRIRPDMPADVTFTLEEKKKNIILAPIGAVGKDGNGNYVFKLEPKDEASGLMVAKKVAVEIGPVSDAGFVIESGLNDGDRIAAAGLNVLRNGAEVRLYEDSE